MLSSRSLAKSCIPPNQGIGHRQEVWRLISKRALKSPPNQGIVFVGSSIFRLWKTLELDMEPLPVFNQAFGGSRTWEVLHYTDRLIIPHRPKIIVYYCGSNDINAGADEKAIHQRFQIFVKLIKAHFPQTRIFFVSINRVPQKQDKWHIVDRANLTIKLYSEETSNLEFIDVNPLLFNHQGEPRLELFLNDGVHLKLAAYQEFTRIIRPRIQKTWNELL